MSWSEKNELWGRWRRGESLPDIAQALRRAPSVVYVAVEAGGGLHADHGDVHGSP
jgi:hypothetical protein